MSKVKSHIPADPCRQEIMNVLFDGSAARWETLVELLVDRMIERDGQRSRRLTGQER